MNSNNMESKTNLLCLLRIGQSVQAVPLIFLEPLFPLTPGPCCLGLLMSAFMVISADFENSS